MFERFLSIYKSPTTVNYFSTATSTANTTTIANINTATLKEQNIKNEKILQKYPVFKNGARKNFYPLMGLALVISVGVAELYWNFYVIPRRNKRDKWFKDHGIEYTPLIEI